jgi:hypothetical protein
MEAFIGQQLDRAVTVPMQSDFGVEFTLWWRKPSSSCILEPSPDAGLAKISERPN